LRVRERCSFPRSCTRVSDPRDGSYPVRSAQFQGARTIAVTPTPSLLLGDTGGTQCHGRPKRSSSADWAVPGGRTRENTQI
jgi:hypothetical protein